MIRDKIFNNVVFFHNQGIVPDSISEFGIRLEHAEEIAFYQVVAFIHNTAFC